MHVTYERVGVQGIGEKLLLTALGCLQGTFQLLGQPARIESICILIVNSLRQLPPQRMNLLLQLVDVFVKIDHELPLHHQQVQLVSHACYVAPGALTCLTLHHNRSKAQDI